MLKKLFVYCIANIRNDQVLQLQETSVYWQIVVLIVKILDLCFHMLAACQQRQYVTARKTKDEYFKTAVTHKRITQMRAGRMKNFNTLKILDE